ncbi:MAG TPA: FAD-dependent oxidoreductase [Chitinophagaceae bacterium]
MQVDYLIVGQGIGGTMLSWFLYKEGKSFVVIDEAAPDAPSKVAAGVMNPVTGRRYVRSWKIDEILPFAAQAYEHMGLVLGQPLLYKKPIIDFFPNPQARDVFVNLIAEDDTYVHTYPDQNHFNQYVNYDFGCGEISPAYTVDLQLMADTWRKKLADTNALREEKFDAQALKLNDDSVTYGNITAQKAIFCEGIAAMNNPWFGLLPFSANKGEALIIESDELHNGYIFKKSMALVPLPRQNTYWVGSDYARDFEDNTPTQAFYDKTVAYLQSWLKVPFKVVDHKAAVRPATVERRPFVGLHPLHPQIGILNGLGSKGTTLGVFFAYQLAQHLVYGQPIIKEADVARFTRILSK